jgi:hypothetical protein
MDALNKLGCKTDASIFSCDNCDADVCGGFKSEGASGPQVRLMNTTRRCQVPGPVFARAAVSPLLQADELCSRLTLRPAPCHAPQVVMCENHLVNQDQVTLDRLAIPPPKAHALTPFGSVLV